MKSLGAGEVDFSRTSLIFLAERVCLSSSGVGSESSGRKEPGK